MDLSTWYLLPAGIAIATVYGATGISGANFWVPVFLLVVGLDPRVGFWVALLTMLFGSASGLVAHLRQGTVGWGEAGRASLLSVPLAVVGARLAPSMPVVWLVAAFGLFAVLYGVWLIARSGALEDGSVEGGGVEVGGVEVGRWDLRLRAAIGGLLVGAISVGLGALLLPAALRSRTQRTPAAAAGTTLASVFATSVAAAAARLDPIMIATLAEQSGEIAGHLAFAVPGVVVGGQIGPRIVRRLDRRSLARVAGAVLLFAGLLTLARSLG